MMDRVNRTRYGLGAWLAVVASFIPLTSLAQSYTSFEMAGREIVALGSDGFAYNPVVVVSGGGNVPSGTAGRGLLPGQSIPMAQMVVGVGTGGTCNGNPVGYNPQVIGRGAADGYAYLVGYYDGNCNWQYGGILPGQTVPFSKIDAVLGWGNVGGLENPSFLQVIGLGANDGLAYLAGYQDQGGVWHAGHVLPGQTFPLSNIWTARGNSNRVQVIGKAASDGRLYVVAWQSNLGAWNSGQLLPGQSPAITALDWSQGNGSNLQLVGVGTDGFLQLSNWQNSATGVWSVGGALPGGSITSFRDIVAATASVNGHLEVQAGGIGASDNILRMTSWQDTGGVWRSFSPAAPVVQVGVQDVDTVFVNGLNVVGLGYNNRFYVLTRQDTGGVWRVGADITP